MKKVAILSYNNCALFETACAVELFGLDRPEFDNWYQADVVSMESGVLASSCNVGLSVKTVKTLKKYDMLIVPSWPVDQRTVLPHLAKQIRLLHKARKTIVSFCSGAFLLAELGLLDSMQATTHWRYADAFRQRFKEVEYVDDVLYVLSDTIGTSAGSAAAIDLGIELIRRDYGSERANQVARRLVMSPHRKGGQSQYIDSPMSDNKSGFDDTLNWAIENLDKPIGIDELAEKSHMSRRSFDRHFRSTHGSSAKQWLIDQRLKAAKLGLEENSVSIERVANNSGFETAASLRHHFRKNLGVSPRQYRDQFSLLTNHPS